MTNLAVVFIVSVTVPGSLSVVPDTCVDSQFCSGSCDQGKQVSLECPRKCKVCSDSPMSPQEAREISERKPRYQCSNGWSEIPGNQITDWGAMKSMTGRIDFANLAGKSMQIYGYSYASPAYLYFESQDAPKNILFYMDLDLPKHQIRLSTSKDGQWSNYAVFSMVLRCCSQGFYPRAHYFWMIEIRFGTRANRQFIDIINTVEGETAYRFYPNDEVKPYDRYYFTQAGYSVLSVTWSNNGYMVFKSGLPVGSEIQLMGKTLEGHLTITLTKANGDTSAIIIFRREVRTTTEVEVTMKGIIAKDKCADYCYYADMYDYKLTHITIRRKTGGFEVWHKGHLFVTMDNPGILKDDIVKIDVMTGFETYGISVLDC
ncbi:hypothetical protein AB6A40_001967 [Gnathostoma spinigerum]|uniref:Uncharacterized protein n=1 Tax=Gnathostoma spinigerum TaxID=75299 RepID=A0ABD6E5K2_9BILA